MKIALVTTSFLPVTGGAEFVVHHLANSWADQGHEVLVVNTTSASAAQTGARYTTAKYRVLRGATRFGYHRTPWVQFATRGVGNLLNSFEPELVSAHTAIPTAFYMSRLRPARKWILTCHGPDVIRGHSQAGSERDRYNIDPLLAASVNAAKRVIAISSIAGKSLIDIGVRSDKIAFISNGVDVKAFEKRIEFDWHKHLGIDPINKIVLTVARNYPEKNLSYGVRAFAKLARENRNIHYVVIGRGSAGLSSVVSEEGIAGRVSLLDPEIGDRLTSLFQHATVFFLPSLWECCPLVILEAMAAGLPQVATDVAGTNEFVENGKTGFLVGETNMDEAGECLRRVLFDQELRANMASSCKKEALRYDWAEIGRKYLETAAG